MSYKIGDRVEVITPEDLSYGKRGTVIGIGSTIAVRMDIWHPLGHSCYGKCEEGYGRHYLPQMLKLIDSSGNPIETDWREDYNKTNGS